MAQMPFTTPPAFAGAARPPGRAPTRPRTGSCSAATSCWSRSGRPIRGPSDDPRVRERPSWARLPLLKNNNWLWSEPLRTLYLGRLGGHRLLGRRGRRGARRPPGHGWEGLRTLFSVLDDAHFALAGRALQLLDWDRSHQFCGRCGTPTEPKREERVRVCPACKLSAYPRVAPAVMALVTRGRELLLGRSPHFPPGMYSALAGFVEPGESLEQCVAREVAEEVGVRVTQHVATSPASRGRFPTSLMIAFVCEWVERRDPPARRRNRGRKLVRCIAIT